MTAQPAAAMPGDPRLGRLIREQIARRRLTIDELAADIGVHRSTLSRWLMGTVYPSPSHLAALEDALGVRFVDDGAGTFTALDVAPEPTPTPQVVVVVAGTAEAMREALDRLGVPHAE
jgi:transcriptional regulator with XRE-family HTH domain